MSALPQQLERVVLALCEDVGSPVATRVASLVREKDYRQLVNMTVDPSHYACPRRYLDDASCVDLLRKFADFKIDGIDKAAVAQAAFWQSEKVCCRTNARLTPFVQNGPFGDSTDGVLIESIERMKTWVKNVLGPLPKEVYPRFGPGATFRDVGKYITVPDKISSRPTTTRNARLFLPLWEKTAWARALFESYPSISDPEDIRGNRFTTVPKDATKDRGICIEPGLNVFYQLAIGGAIRKRLKNVGIDLNEGQDIHRRVVEEASRTGAFATIDLSNASDTVSYQFVKLILPEGWFDVVDTLRSPMTWVDGKGWVHLQKFSSMGNGFTFELETLLFAAIVAEACFLTNIQPVTGTNCFVYGDDIILPSQAAQTALSLLAWFGFTPNPKKTFVTGVFRESCGGDFFSGVAVRPHYLKETPDEPAKWISLANGIRRMGSQNPSRDFRWSVFWRAWLRCLDAIPSDIRRCRGPEDLGDLVIHDHPEYWWRRRTRDQRTFLRTWAPVIPKLAFHHWKPPIVLAAALYGLDQDGVSTRGDISGYRLRWTSYAT